MPDAYAQPAAPAAANLPVPAAPALQGEIMPPAPMFHDVTIVTTRKIARARVEAVAPEEFGIERSARGIRDSNYCFHEVVTKTEGQLISEGFDQEQVKALETYTGLTSTETQRRDAVQEHQFQTNEINTAAPCPDHGTLRSYGL